MAKLLLFQRNNDHFLITSDGHYSEPRAPRAILEDLVIACGLAINQQAGDAAKRTVTETRATG